MRLKGWLVALCLCQNLPSALGVTLETHYWFPAGPINPYAGLVRGNDGNFYGTARYGHPDNYGAVFKVTTNGTVTTLVEFNSNNGAHPQTGLTLGSDGNLYGTTENGGNPGYGTVFKVTTSGALTSLYSFPDGPYGQHPLGKLVQGSDGSFYGTRFNSGNNNLGTVFVITPSGVFTTLVNFAFSDGANPQAGLVQASDGFFYGTTEGGGTNGGLGTVFKMSSSGTLISLVSFEGANGSHPHGELIQGRDGNFYGTTQKGGAYGTEVGGYGTVFKMSPTGTLTTLVSFDNTNGVYPNGALVQAKDGHFYGTTSGGGTNGGHGTIFRVTADGTLISLVSFDKTNGAQPYGGLVEDDNGNLYGTTFGGGSGGQGTVFRVTTNGTLASLASFNFWPHGAYPYGGLITGSDGQFYGTTDQGGTNGTSFGTVFKLALNGTLTTLASFAQTNGANPHGRLLQARDGDFYGTTKNGGLDGDYGTVFKMTPDGTLSWVVSFAGTNGAHPYAGVIQGSDGNLYGTTLDGGEQNYGTIFRITTAGSLTMLASLTGGTNGIHPKSELIEGNDGNFYGTTTGGGLSDHGSIFMMTPSGTFTTLGSLNGLDGSGPHGGLAQDDEGNFYGTAAGGGTPGNQSHGTIFRLLKSGSLNTVYLFGSSSGDGTGPMAALLRATDGHFYGTTYAGGKTVGSFSYGTVFKLTTNGVFTSLARFSSADGANPYGQMVEGSDGYLYGTTFQGGGDVSSRNQGFGSIFRLGLDAEIISQPTHQTAQVGGEATFIVTARGVGPITYQWRKNGGAIGGATNTAFTLTDVAADDGATYTVAVKNPNGTVISSNATLTVLCPLMAVTPTTLPPATVGQNYTVTNVASGGVGPYTYRIPRGFGFTPGLTLSSDGVLSGAPTSKQTFNFTIRATDSYGCIKDQTHALTPQCPVITLGLLPTATVDTAYNHTNTASGGTGPYTFELISGNLPPGLALHRGVVSGTPTALGEYHFAIAATDYHYCSGTNNYTLQVAESILLVNPSVDSNGWFWAQVTGPAGSPVVVLTSTNAAEPIANWVPLITNTSLNGTFDFADTNSIDSTKWPQRFYRARVSP